MKEKVVLIGLELQNKKNAFSIESSLRELEELVISADGEVVFTAVQKRTKPDNSLFIGRGKAEELKEIIDGNEIELAIFDDELSGTQIRNLEEIFGIRVIDRTNLILDIFAKRAKTREGKLQVELAQLSYLLPRLTGMGVKMSRLGAGIGTRGPGEKKLETDRRHIRRRVKHLKAELEKIKKRRKIMTERRLRNRIPTAALVGYTNAGKSTLLNCLCRENIYADNRLFATLEPTTRKLRVAEGKNILISDTVGFIRKLPHDLVEAFLATLEEVKTADLLLIVVDLSDEMHEEHIEVVYDILGDLGIVDPNTIVVYNKTDLLQSDDMENGEFTSSDKVFISAKDNIGIMDLIEKIEDRLFGN